MTPALRRSAVVFVAYAALTLVWAHFMLGSVTTAFAHDTGDPLLNSWILWWNASTVPFSTAWWNAPAYYPATDVAAFTESLVGLWPLTSPIIWITGNSILAHNIALLVSFPLAGLCGYWLCRELTGDDLAAFLGGLAFALAPYRVAQVPHLQVLQAYWLPLALFALHRYLRTADRRNLLVFAAAWILNGLTNGYFLMFFGVLFGLWLLWFVVLPRRWRDLASILVTTAIASIPLVAILWKYKRVHETYGFVRDLEEIQRFSGDVAALATAVDSLSLWHWLRRFPRAEGELFPGLWVPALLVVALCVLLASGAARPQRLAASRAFYWFRAAAGAVLAGAIAALALVGLVGPFRTFVAGVRVSLTSVDRLVVLAAVAFVCLVATRRWDLRRRLSPPVFYGAAAVLLWLFALGPTPTYFGRPVLSTGAGWMAPYSWLLALPGFESLRVPPRLWMLVLVCLSVLAAFAFARIAGRHRLLRAALAAVVGAGLLSDAWAGRMPVVEARRLWNCPAPAAGAGAVIVAPIGDTLSDLTAMDLAMQWRVSSINGYSGYYAPHYEAVVYGIGSRDHGMLDDLAGRRGLYAVVGPTLPTWHAFFASHPRAISMGQCDGAEIFRIRGQRTDEVLDDRLEGGPLPIASLTADVGTDIAALALDGDLTTRWQSGDQQDSHWIYADLGQSRTVTGLLLEGGAFASDFPRRLVVEIGEEVGYWTQMYDGPTHRRVFRGALADPKRAPMKLPLPAMEGRYVRLRQVGRDREYWSIAELKLYGR